MEFTNRDLVGKGFELLAEGLEPFVAHHLARVVPGGTDWLEWLSKQGPNRGMTQSKSDPLVLLRAITGRYGDVFKNSLSRAELAYAHELWECRNNWAHNSLFNDADTRRLLDTIERFLRAAEASAEADAVQRLLHDHMRPATQSPNQQASHESDGQGRSDHVAPEPNEESSRPGTASEEVPLSNSLGVLIGIAIGIFGVLLAVGLAFLPSASSTEKALISACCAALSVAAVSGVGAWRGTGRFIATTSGVLAIVCLGCLSITASHANRTQPPAAGSTSSPDASVDRRPAASGSPGRSSAPASTTPTKSASQTQATTAVPTYLADLTPTTVQDGIVSVAPQAGEWQMSGVFYPHSLAYSADSDLCSLQQTVTYQIPSSSRSFVATVGVIDTVSNPQDQGDTVEFQVDNDSGDQIGAQTAQYGETAVIDVTFQDLTSLTLITSSTVGCFGDSSTLAVWGSPRVAS